MKLPFEWKIYEEKDAALTEKEVKARGLEEYLQNRPQKYL